MIRNLYTNKDLKKVPKYQKFLILRTYNLFAITVLWAFITVNSIKLVKTTPLLGLTSFLGFSFAIYILVVMHNKSFYGLFTPIKSYQEHMLVMLGNNKSKHGALSLINSAFLGLLFYFAINSNLIYAGIFTLITFLLHMILVDTNDLGKIGRVAKKLDVDVSEYRLFDNDLFESLTTEQIFYVHSVREQLVVFCVLNKELTAKEFNSAIDKEEYLLITMIANQMEKLGK